MVRSSPKLGSWVALALALALPLLAASGCGNDGPTKPPADASATDVAGQDHVTTDVPANTDTGAGVDARPDTSAADTSDAAVVVVDTGAPDLAADSAPADGAADGSNADGAGDAPAPVDAAGDAPADTSAPSDTGNGVDAGPADGDGGAPGDAGNDAVPAPVPGLLSPRTVPVTASTPLAVAAGAMLPPNAGT